MGRACRLLTRSQPSWPTGATPPGSGAPRWSHAPVVCGRPFGPGSPSHVCYAPTPAEPTARLVLRVALEGLTTPAMGETGGLALLCMPSVVHALHWDVAQGFGAPPRLCRDERVQSTRQRLILMLLAEGGEDMQLDVTAFVPDTSSESVPELPSILGLHGCLARVRFAFDPATDTFYFGPASPTA
jgi:hypothetical protein